MPQTAHVLSSADLAAERKAWLERRSKKVAETTERRRVNEQNWGMMLSGEQLRMIRDNEYLPPEDLSRKKR